MGTGVPQTAHLVGTRPRGMGLHSGQAWGAALSYNSHGQGQMKRRDPGWASLQEEQLLALLTVGPECDAPLGQHVPHCAEVIKPLQRQREPADTGAHLPVERLSPSLLPTPATHTPRASLSQPRPLPCMASASLAREQALSCCTTPTTTWPSRANTDLGDLPARQAQAATRKRPACQPAHLHFKNHL